MKTLLKWSFFGVLFSNYVPTCIPLYSFTGFGDGFSIHTGVCRSVTWANIYSTHEKTSLLIWHLVFNYTVICTWISARFGNITSWSDGTMTSSCSVILATVSLLYWRSRVNCSWFATRHPILRSILAPRQSNTSRLRMLSLVMSFAT